VQELTVINLGRMRYAEALAVQRAHLEEVLARREAGKAGGAGRGNGAGNGAGRLLLVEHEPVITVSKRAESSGNLRASEAQLKEAGVEIERTDRGGDITYHGPGQLVVYPILDLNVLGLRLVEYIRLLESVIIETVGSFGIKAHTEAGATGVWVGAEATERRRDEETKWGAEATERRSDEATEGERQKGQGPPLPQCPLPGAQCLLQSAKIAAIGVRVRRWVSMHGFALNVDPNLEHFDLIVPCGLEGRAVTSMREVLGDGGAACPSMTEVSARVVEVMEGRIGR
jgi:lipoyl(octanoyl) transferase